MLVPAGLLILMILGAISVDSAIAYSAKRELQNEAAAIANDVATSAVSPESVSINGPAVNPDPTLVDELAQQRFALNRSTDARVKLQKIETAVDGQTVTISIKGSVDYIFAKAVPGIEHTQAVSASASTNLVAR